MRIYIYIYIYIYIRTMGRERDSMLVHVFLFQA